MKSETCREAFSEKILEEAKKDKSVIVVCTDSRGSASLGKYPQELPNQFVELGIAEQNAVTVSAGMASIGKKVFTVGPASFYSTRAAEQVKVDVAYSRNNVKIVGISGGISYGALGATHHSLQDIALMRAIPGLIVEIPSDAVQMRKIVDVMVETEEPAYIRIGRGAVPVLYEEDVQIMVGKSICWGDGTDAAVIACGQMVWRALEAAELLKREGISVRVYDMHTIKPMDKEAVLEAAEECGCILTVEEHSLHGGMGGAVAEIICRNCPIPLEILAVPDEDIPNGTDEEVFRYYHMDPEGIADGIRELHKRKNQKYILQEGGRNERKDESLCTNR
ncbi:transketolase family protein [Suipraeoptans intestinalis]|uniref:transketolase family protein n=1 Tax=Suipraeoptans intestinalis TaxID=2606628 RepID=UPI002A75C9A8|nr:transketolase C-terminal domain-containing protein [Suipraeoptans intestinalis]MDY3121973.1 transketolase C-terminal domain-containing protein [Suipraeoptans intestinalis]